MCIISPPEHRWEKSSPIWNLIYCFKFSFRLPSCHSATLTLRKCETKENLEPRKRDSNEFLLPLRSNSLRCLINHEDFIGFVYVIYDPITPVKWVRSTQNCSEIIKCIIYWGGHHGSKNCFRIKNFLIWHRLGDNFAFLASTVENYREHCESYLRENVHRGTNYEISFLSRN